MKLLKIFKQSDYIRNISVIVSGTAFAQLITIASIPILTRQYSTDIFGNVGVLMAIVSLLSTVSSGRYNMSVMLPKNENNAFNLLAYTVILQVAFVIMCVALIPFSKHILFLLSIPEIEPFLVYIPIMVLATSVNNTLEYWFGRKKKFIYLSIAAVIAAVTSNAWKAFFGIDIPTTRFMLIGNILNLLLPLCIYLYIEYNNLKLLLFRDFSLKRIVVLAKEYDYFPKYRAPKDFLNSATQNAPTFLLVTLFSVTEVGFYVLADRIMRVPGVLIGQAVRKVFYQKASEANNKSDRSLFQATLSSTLGLATIGFLPYMLVFLFGDDLFSLILGEQWVKAGVYASWISVWMFFVFVGVPAVVIIPIINLEKFFLIYEIFSMTITLTALIVGGTVLKNDMFAIILYTSSNAMLNAFMIVYVLVHLKKLERQ